MRTQAAMEKLMAAAMALLLVMAAWQLVVNRQFDPVGLASALTMTFSAYCAHRHAPRFIKAKYMKGRNARHDDIADKPA